MAYFVWADDMVVDHGPLDADHLKLVELVNALNTATSEGRGYEVIDHIMSDLIVYTQEHLQREEQMMAAMKFPHLERHQAGHAHFVKSLTDLRQKYEAGSLTVPAQLSMVLRDWLSLHIRRSDREIRVFVQKARKHNGSTPGDA
ncbi:MAG: hemerythrin [Burkholderiales bacterium PBB4]|nr:MAG: hemerythrin [Burkholderiales bacterium PBB4]